MKICVKSDIKSQLQKEFGANFFKFLKIRSLRELGYSGSIKLRKGGGLKTWKSHQKPRISGMEIRFKELAGKVVFPCPVRWNIKEKPLKTHTNVLVMEAEESEFEIAMLENSYLAQNAPSLGKESEQIAVIKGSLKVAP